jgi:metal-dependent amidase/aminoacylase/carboxypeptidase family protein
MPTFTLKGGSTPLINDAALVAPLNVPLKELVGEKNVISEFPPATGSEDVHFLRGDHKVPFDFILVGIADPEVFAEARKQGKFLPYAAHNGDFRFAPA